jgi:hypothetical protein
MVTATYTGAGAPSPDSRLVVKDAIAPGPVSSDLPSGTYATPQTVNLTGENEVRFTTDGSTPTAASARFTAPLLVTTSRTIKAVAIDAAGNVGPVATFASTLAVPVASQDGTASTGASVPVLGPSIVVVGQTVPVAVPVRAVAAATTSTTAAVSRLSLARRVSVTELRARGLRASMAVAEGTNVVRIAVSRARNGATTGRAVFVTTRSPSAPGLFRVTLRSIALRG